MDTSIPSGNSDGAGPSSRALPRQQLPTALLLHILSFLPDNDRALSGRLVCREIHDALGKDSCVVYMFEPLPAHAVVWAMDDWQHHAKRLPFQHKLQLLCAAARSGSEANMEVAWAFLHPSIFPEALREARTDPWWPDPGVAAVTEGHPHLLPWLLHRCPGLVSPQDVMRLAAWGCDLEGMESAWDALKGCQPSDSEWSSELLHLDACVVEAAAQSDAPDAVDKMNWAVDDGARLYETTADAAIRSGIKDRVQWLQRQGCPLGWGNLRTALKHADLDMAEWLLDEVGVELPAARGQKAQEWWWEYLLVAAVEGADGVEKLQWLLEQGAPPLDSDMQLTYKLLLAAVRAGRVEVVRHLLSVFGPEPMIRADPGALGCAAAKSDSEPMAECLRQSGLVFTAGAYEAAAAAGKIDMVWWLAKEAGVSAAGLDLAQFVERWKGKSRHFLETVQLLVEEKGCQGWDATATLCAAAEHGELGLVQYLLQHRPGHQPAWDVLVAAAEGGCEALLEWMVEQHPCCLEGPRKASPYVLVARRYDLGTLTALRRLGVPWGAEDVVVQVVSKVQRKVCKMPALRWLVEQGAPVGSRQALEEAVATCVRGKLVSAADAAWLRSLGAA